MLFSLALYYLQLGTYTKIGETSWPAGEYVYVDASIDHVYLDRHNPNGTVVYDWLPNSGAFWVDWEDRS